jgi:hypothetical protein
MIDRDGHKQLIDNYLTNIRNMKRKTCSNNIAQTAILDFGVCSSFISIKPFNRFDIYLGI